MVYSSTCTCSGGPQTSIGYTETTGKWYTHFCGKRMECNYVSNAKQSTQAPLPLSTTGKWHIQFVE